MAQAVVEERQLLKTLRWYDGFALALANPGFLLGSLGYSVLDLGGWGAAMLWGITAFLILFVMVLYSELAAMFPHKSGGFPLYANEGWRKYTTLVGPIATFGYWLGWSVVLAFLGLFVGSIAQAAWWPDATYGTNAFGGAEIDAGYFSIPPGSVHIGLQHLIAIGVILCVWVFNVFGARIAVTFNYLAGPAPDDPALRLHVPAVPERRLRLGEPDVQAGRSRPRLGRLADGARLDLAHDLVGGRRRHVRDVRARVQGHRQGHEESAPLGVGLLAHRLHDPADRPRRRRWRGDRRGVRLRRRAEPARRERARRTSSSSSSWRASSSR